MTVTHDISDFLSPLAACMDDAGAFADVARQLDWSESTAPDFLRAVHLALAAGAHLTARELAMRGAERFPTDSELAKAAHLLAPPAVAAAEGARHPLAEPDRRWLRDHRDDYHGQWVALRSGRLIESATTAGELMQHVQPSAGVLITRVY